VKNEIAYYGKDSNGRPGLLANPKLVANPNLGVVSNARKKKHHDFALRAIITNQSFKLQNPQTISKTSNLAMIVPLALMASQDGQNWMPAVPVSGEFSCSLRAPVLCSLLSSSCISFLLCCRCLSVISLLFYSVLTCDRCLLPTHRAGLSFRLSSP
jgi:hypothetical protein